MLMTPIQLLIVTTKNHNMEKYYGKWQLIVNESKIKVMNFVGKTTVKKHL